MENLKLLKDKMQFALWFHNDKLGSVKSLRLVFEVSELSRSNMKSFEKLAKENAGECFEDDEMFHLNFSEEQWKKFQLLNEFEQLELV